MNIDEVLKLLEIEELTREQPTLQAIRGEATKRLAAIADGIGKAPAPKAIARDAFVERTPHIERKAE